VESSAEADAKIAMMTRDIRESNGQKHGEGFPVYVIRLRKTRHDGSSGPGAEAAVISRRKK